MTAIRGAIEADPLVGAYRFTIRAALSSASATADTLPPRATARNTGPALISAAASHVCRASNRAQTRDRRGRCMSVVPRSWWRWVPQGS